MYVSRRLSVNIERIFLRGGRPLCRLVSSCAHPLMNHHPVVLYDILMGPLDTCCHLVSARNSPALACGETMPHTFPVRLVLFVVKESPLSSARHRCVSPRFCNPSGVQAMPIRPFENKSNNRCLSISSYLHPFFYTQLAQLLSTYILKYDIIIMISRRNILEVFLYILMEPADKNMKGA